MGDSSFGTFSIATLITVTGTGFPSSQDSIAVGYITLNKAVSAANFNALTLIRPSLSSSTTATNDVLADVNGYFKAQFYVPTIQAGTYAIVAQYTPSSGSQTLSPTASFAVNAQVAVIDVGSGLTSSIYSSAVDILLSGFQAGETVSLAPTTLFVTTQFQGAAAYGSFSLTGTNTATCSTVATTGRCTGGQATVAYVTDHKGGTFTITATGGTSSQTAVGSFTVLPSVAFLVNPTGPTTLSIPAAGGALYVEGFGFGASTTISGNSLTVTVGSTTTTAIMLSVTTNTVGDFAATRFTVTQSLPTGLASVALNGTTFSWTNGNIIPPVAVGTSLIASAMQYRGALISSSLSGPAYVLTDSSSYTSLVSEPAFFGVNFATTALTAATYTPTAGSAAAYTVDGGSDAGAGTGIATVFATKDGAFMAWASAGTTPVPASFGNNNLFTFTASTISGQAPVTITPVARYLLTGSAVRSGTTSTMTLSNGNAGTTPLNRQPRTTQYSLTVAGFNEYSGSTATIGSVDSSFTITLTSSGGTITTWASITGATTACTTNTPPSSSGMCVNNSPGNYVFNLGTAPDLPGGSYTLTATGTSTGNTATAAVSYAPAVQGQALSVTSANSGTSVAFSTTTTRGVHGLAASTAYSIMLDGPTGTSLGTFTSTSLGQVPPGTQITVPSGAAGRHIVDIVASGSTASAIYGNIIPEVAGSSQYNGYTAGSTYTSTKTSNTGTTGLTLTINSVATFAPNVGSPSAIVTVSAAGLTPSTVFYVVLNNDVSYASFTSTATGTVPAGTTFTFPNIPITTAGDEQGESQTVYISSKALFTQPNATGTFILQSSLKLSASTGAAGSTLTVTAAALANGQAYNVIFNYGVNSGGTAITGTTVGSISGGTDGTASGQFTVPSSAAPGSYTIQLVRATGTNCPTSPNCASLAFPPTLTVGGGATGCASTTCMTASGSASESVVSGQATVSQSFTSTASSAVSVYMWVSVMNSQGQTVGVFLGSATVAAGATQTIGAALFNLPSGTYTAQVFVTTTSGIVVSTTSTTSSFTV